MGIEDGNLFMMCASLRQEALRALPEGYVLRSCRKEELELWKRLQFDDEQTAREYHAFMTAYFDTVYAPKGELFFQKCRLVLTARGEPVGTCFVWKAYDAAQTVHWFKVRKDCEGRGLGRALLSAVLGELGPEDFPVFLHTHPACLRALKLYADFGFQLLTDPVFGGRHNDWAESLPYLRAWLPPGTLAKLRPTVAPAWFPEVVAAAKTEQF